MKKFLNQLSTFQLSAYEFIKKEVSDDGDNLIEVILEIEQGYDSVPEIVHIAFASMSPIERVEIVYFSSRYIMRKNKN